MRLFCNKGCAPDGALTNAEANHANRAIVEAERQIGSVIRGADAAAVSRPPAVTARIKKKAQPKAAQQQKKVPSKAARPQQNIVMPRLAVPTAAAAAPAPQVRAPIPPLPAHLAPPPPPPPPQPTVPGLQLLPPPEQPLAVPVLEDTWTASDSSSSSRSTTPSAAAAAASAPESSPPEAAAPVEAEPPQAAAAPPPPLPPVPVAVPGPGDSDLSLGTAPQSQLPPLPVNVEELSWRPAVVASCGDLLGKEGFHAQAIFDAIPGACAELIHALPTCSYGMQHIS